MKSSGSSLQDILEVHRDANPEARRVRLAREADMRRARRRAQELIKEGYYQTSRRHRHLAKLPEGMTGKQALLEHAKKERPWDAEQWVEALGERAAAGHYLACYAQPLVVNEDTFRAFREAGGRTREQSGD